MSNKSERASEVVNQFDAVEADPKDEYEDDDNDDNDDEHKLYIAAHSFRLPLFVVVQVHSCQSF